MVLRSLLPNRLSRTNSFRCIPRRFPRVKRRSSHRFHSNRIHCAAHKITLLPGDGIGPEISHIAVNLLEATGNRLGEVFEVAEADFGGYAIDKHGEALPQSTLDVCKNSDAVLLAAIGGSKWDALSPSKRPERGLLDLRTELGTFANLRPALVHSQLAEASSLKTSVVSGVDIMIVRELNGGIYYGEPRGVKKSDSGERIGFNTMVYSESEIERILHVAFEIAMKRQRRLCSVGKSNVLEVYRLWEEILMTMSKKYPDVEVEIMYVDNAAMKLISQPKYFDTIVTGNMFGDILSDAAATLTGSLGLLPSASLSDHGPGLFEPVHGSAPDIAGQDAANPLAMVLSAAMMCRYGLNLPKAADLIEAAVLSVLDRGYRTIDIQSEGTTIVSCSQMGELLMEDIQTLVHN